MTAEDLGLAARERRHRLGLSLDDLRMTAGIGTGTYLLIELGRSFVLHPDVLGRLDIAMQWPTGHATELLHTPPPLSDPDSRAPQPLSEPSGDIAEILSHALAPTLLPRLQRLQLHDLSTLDTNTLLLLDEIIPDRPDDRGPRTVAALADGRTVAFRTLRVERGLTQQELADAVTSRRRDADPHSRPITATTISGIESGYRGASDRLSRELEQYFNLPAGAITKNW